MDAIPNEKMVQIVNKIQEYCEEDLKQISKEYETQFGVPSSLCFLLICSVLAHLLLTEKIMLKRKIKEEEDGT